MLRHAFLITLCIVALLCVVEAQWGRGYYGGYGRPRYGGWGRPYGGYGYGRPYGYGYGRPYGGYGRRYYG
ncbi:hypothetical protein RB195_015653 [Necator americanus]|uniref:Neuropeptide-like protein 33 family protein n=2 Tax=Necator americanus TaxID=51031 RepID=A0ABR1E5J2_NECAM